MGGADDVLKLEVRDEGAEPAEAAAVDEAAAAVHTPVGQVQLFPHRKHLANKLRMDTPSPCSGRVFVAFLSCQRSSALRSAIMQHPARTSALPQYYFLQCLNQPEAWFSKCCFMQQAPGRRRPVSPSNEGSLSYTVGDLKERLRALKLPLNGRKAELLERLKAALAADTAASGAPPADAVAAEEKPQPAAADPEAQEQPDTAAPKAKRRKAAVAKKPQQNTAAAVQPAEPIAEHKPDKAAAGRRKRVQPGTAALGPIATAKVIFDRPYYLFVFHQVHQSCHRGAGARPYAKCHVVVQLLSCARAGCGAGKGSGRRGPRRRARRLVR